MSKKRPKKYREWRDSPSVKVPRQTLSDWRRRIFPLKDFESFHNVDGSFGCFDETDSEDETASFIHECDEEISNLISTSESETESSSESNSSLSSSDESDEEFDYAGLSQQSINGPQENQSSLVYSSASITSNESALLLLKLAARHNLTNAALSDVLKVVRRHLPKNEDVPGHLRSVYMLKKAIADQTEIITHTYCNSCQKIVEGDECTNGLCARSDKKSVKFYRISIEDQIIKLFKSVFTIGICLNLLTSLNDSQFLEKLSLVGRGHRDDSLNDVFDGRTYCEKMRLFAQETADLHLSLSLSTDGVQIFKSSTVTMWPVWIRINELQPSIRIYYNWYFLKFDLQCSNRFYKKYKILAGLWIANYRPPMLWFLKPIVENLNHIATSGFSVPVGNRHMHCKAFLQVVVADLPAKAAVLSHTLFNGKHGCTYCVAEGEVVERGRGHARIYKPDSAAIMRTHKSVLENAEASLTVSASVKGVKGVSPLTGLKHFDLVTSVGIDYMHCVLEGVVKKLLNLWFEFSLEIYCITRFAGVVDKRLSTIRPPENVTRLPTSILKRKHWKAAEYRTWLLYYSLPVLESLLPDHLWWHYALLVTSVFIFLKDNISRSDLEEAKTMITKFAQLFQHFYGDEHCTINLHLLGHLPQDVENHGPLWTHSAFEYESMNGYLTKTVHSTHNVQTQVVAAWKMAFGSSDDGSSESYGMDRFSSKRSKKTELEEKVFGLGLCQKSDISGEEKEAIHSITGHRVESTVLFKRIFIAHMGCIHSSRYSRASKRNNFTVVIKKNDQTEYAQIQNLISATLENGRTINCVVYLPLLEEEDFFTVAGCPEDTMCHLSAMTKTVKTVKHGATLKACKMAEIQNRVVAVESNRKTRVIIVPNCYERD